LPSLIGAGAKFAHRLGPRSRGPAQQPSGQRGIRRLTSSSETLTPTKSGKIRSVPLVDQAARALDALSKRERWTGEEDRIFVNDVGEQIEDSALRRRFYQALDRAGLPRIRFHDLRHTFGTIAVQAFPLTDVKAFMGHGHPDDDDLRPPRAPARRGRPAHAAARRPNSGCTRVHVGCTDHPNG
jgi:integrase